MTDTTTIRCPNCGSFAWYETNGDALFACDDCDYVWDHDDPAAVTAREDAENRAIRDEMLRDEEGVDW